MGRGTQEHDRPQTWLYWVLRYWCEDVSLSTDLLEAFSGCHLRVNVFSHVHPRQREAIVVPSPWPVSGMRCAVWCLRLYVGVSGSGSCVFVPMVWPGRECPWVCACACVCWPVCLCNMSLCVCVCESVL